MVSSIALCEGGLFIYIRSFGWRAGYVLFVMIYPCVDTITNALCSIELMHIEHFLLRSTLSPSVISTEAQIF